MQAERQYQEIQSRTIQPKREKIGGTPIVDNRNIAQVKLIHPIQRVGLFGEEDAAVQGKFVTQLQEEDEHILQGKFDTIQKKANNTGLPDNLKSGVENMSGLNMDDVKVHYNSDKPAQMQAHAYAQGTDIHVAPGQEKHLAHEAWHVVQQKQGRVRPTMQLQGVYVNNDTSLESEADIMGSKAMQMQEININNYDK